jgi:hypothetical protein
VDSSAGKTLTTVESAWHLTALIQLGFFTTKFAMHRASQVIRSKSPTTDIVIASVQQSGMTMEQLVVIEGHMEEQLVTPQMVRARDLESGN